ncbi:MAG: hypothetical protein PHQ95_03225 [Candidatus Gracilibacteria bacterium]|nr:hypothetical protein [Candidatus Gracilibacteria bacterium]
MNAASFIRKFILILLLLSSVFILSGCTFVGDSHKIVTSTPGLFMGIWHGLVAPYTLIARYFIDIQMYAIPNSGFMYDLGFLGGMLFSLPVGWMAAIISVIIFLL